jgi:hypothetical protein
MRNKITALFAFLVAACVGQAQVNQYSSTSGDVSLSASGYSFTIQGPVNNSKSIQLVSALIWCSVVCQVTQAQNGTAATVTAGTANVLLPTTAAAVATIFTGSDVGTGTPAGGIIHLAGGQWQTVNLSAVRMGSTAPPNYTFTVSSITGTFNVTLFWKEL